MGMLTGGRHPHTKQALVPALAGTKEQGEALSGARVAQAHSDAGDSRSVYLVARANQERTMDNYLPTQVWTAYGSVVPHTRDKISL